MFRLQLILSISRSRTRPLFGFVPFVPNKSRQKLTRPRFEHGSIDLSPVGNSIEPNPTSRIRGAENYFRDVSR
jgi:hypothetical protein